MRSVFFALLIYAAVPAFAAPIDLAATPAGRWLTEELGLKVANRLVEIHARYARAVSAEDSAFTSGSRTPLGRGQRAILQSIAREELGYTVGPWFPLELGDRFLDCTSVRVAGRIRGRHGHTCYLLRRNGNMPWTSGARFRGNALAPQGDPRWMLEIEPTLAEFLGFHQVSTDLLIVPGPDELNAAVKKLNEVLLAHGATPIPFRFLAAPVAASPRQFTSLLLDDIVPYSLDGHMLAHDSAYHAGSILLLEEQLAALKAETRFFEAFERWVRVKRPELVTDPDFENTMDQAWYAYGQRFDVGTGNYAQAARNHRFLDGTRGEHARQIAVLESNLRQTLELLARTAETPAKAAQLAMDLHEVAVHRPLLKALQDFTAADGRALDIPQAALPQADHARALKARLRMLTDAARIASASAKL